MDGGFRHKKRVLVFAIVFSILILVSTAKPSHVSCFQRISSNTVLDSDLTCSSNGPIINADNIVFDCSGYKITGNGVGTGIQAFGKNNITIKNCNIQNFGQGISLEYTSRSYLLNNTVKNNFRGFYIRSSPLNQLSDNKATGNRIGFDIVFESNSNTILNNTAENNHQGIMLDRTTNNTLANNNFFNNTFNFGILFGIFSGSSDFLHNIDTSNRVNGKPIYYLVNKKDIEIPVDAGFVGIIKSNNITVRDLIFTNNLQGILMSQATNSSIENVTSFGNVYGSYISASSNNTFVSNRAFNNSAHGFLFQENSNKNTIINNIAYNNSLDGFQSFLASRQILINNTAVNNSRRGFLIYDSESELYSNKAFSNGVGMELGGSNSILRNNIMSNNTYNFGSSGARGDIDTSNLVNGRPIYYLVDKNGSVIPSDAGYVGLVDSANIVVKGLNLSHNMQGVILASTTNSTIENVTAEKNHNGFYLQLSDDNMLLKNNANDNLFGLHTWYSYNNTIESSTSSSEFIDYLLEYSDSNKLVQNTANGSRVGFYLRYSDSNVLFSNTAKGLFTGFHLEFSHYNNLSSNSAINGFEGFELEGSRNNILTNNKAMDILGRSFTLREFSNFNILRSNLAKNTSHSGFSLVDARNNTLINNTATETSLWLGIYFGNGFSLSSSPSNMLISNTALNNSGQGFYISSSPFSELINNTAISNQKDGLWIFSSRDLQIIANTFCFNNQSMGSYYDIFSWSVSPNNGINNSCQTTFNWNDSGANGCTFSCEISKLNVPPIADAGPDQILECEADLNATAFLNGSGSTDPDSTSGTNDDIVSFDWLENNFLLASGEEVFVPFSLGVHDVTLKVTDKASESDTDDVIITVQDTLPPVGEITGPPENACFGPDSLPVVVTDNFTDRCDSNIIRSYDPPSGPYYTEHGDYNVTINVSDSSNNSASDSVQFTIDTIPPVITIIDPKNRTLLIPTMLPFNITLQTSDDDNATGGVVHEVIKLNGCVIYDGFTYGDGDGLLTDEVVEISQEELCRLSDLCGFTELNNPEIRVEAIDCGGNVGFVSEIFPGGGKLRPGICDDL